MNPCRGDLRSVTNSQSNLSHWIAVRLKWGEENDTSHFEPHWEERWGRNEVNKQIIIVPGQVSVFLWNKALHLVEGSHKIQPKLEMLKYITGRAWYYQMKFISNIGEVERELRIVSSLQTTLGISGVETT